MYKLWALKAGAAIQGGDANTSRSPGPTSCVQEPMYYTVLCHSDTQLAKKETQIPPKHLVPPLVSRSSCTILFVLSDSASVPLYFCPLLSRKHRDIKFLHLFICASVTKKLTLVIAFQCKEIDLSYFTGTILVKRPFTLY